ncbi:MAG TPA: LytTR family DNA-binding domain-containing protein [Bacteroidales bacterium]
MKINCIIIDDEPLARKGLEEYIAEVDFLDLKANCENAIAANNILRSQAIDLIFLDIQMPRMSGIDFLKTLSVKPMVILTTAYSEYALQGYELDVLDYLVKPISTDRFMKAVNKARDFFEMKRSSTSAPEKTEDFFFIKSDKQFEKIFYNDLLFVQALENYVLLQTPERKYIAYITFQSMEEQLPKDRFLKIHKSYIIAISKVDGILGNQVKIKTHSLPISRNLKEEVMKTILSKNLLKR